MNVLNFDFIAIVQEGGCTAMNDHTTSLISVGLPSFDSRGAWRFLRLGLLFKLVMPAIFCGLYIDLRSTLSD
jgi:hypothetical protein